MVNLLCLQPRLDIHHVINLAVYLTSLKADAADFDRPNDSSFFIALQIRCIRLIIKIRQNKFKKIATLKGFNVIYFYASKALYCLMLSNKCKSVAK